MKPRLSIIVPIYNVAPYVEACIGSILEQKYENIEVIIVDDKSPDNSIDLIKRLVTQGVPSNIVFEFIEHKVNKKQGGARNTGLRVATGEYVMFVDSDDRLTPHASLVAMNKIIGTNYDMVVGNRDIIKADTGERLDQSWKRKDQEIIMSSFEDYENYVSVQF